MSWKENQDWMALRHPGMVSGVGGRSQKQSSDFCSWFMAAAGSRRRGVRPACPVCEAAGKQAAMVP